MQVYDARRCYARWCLEAGIPFDRVQQYMGHAPKSMTERYARSTVQQHLKDDAERLRQWIETQRKLKTNTAISRFFDT
jgi:integrase